MTTADSTLIMQQELLGLDAASLQQSIKNHLHYTLGKRHVTATQRDWLLAVSHAVRDRLSERWINTIQGYYNRDCKRVYYLSMEFLLGRSLSNALYCLGIHDACYEAMAALQLNPDEILSLEPDPGLGNGGLGRLAACFLDSMASLRLPGYGYGIRYEFGMFNQRMHNGYQLEQPDNWLRYGNPWEFPHPEVIYQVPFGGRVVEYADERGTGHHWKSDEDVMAMAFDTPIPGFENDTVNTLRLWAAKSSRDFDLEYFNRGDYIKAVEDKSWSETLSKVLYPNDATAMGRELRLRQEYFFVSASIQDIFQRHLRSYDTVLNIKDKVAIQLNDTHPALAIPEFMRQLLDRFHLDWKTAWSLCVNTFAYTNHTLLPEALETWPLEMFERLLPRHLQIIYDINHHFLVDVNHLFPGDQNLIRRVSLIGEEGSKHVRMSHVAVVGSHKVNGVAALHTHLMRQTIFRDFERIYPDRFVNKTNGITPRRWLSEANPSLTQLLNKHLAAGWVTNLTELEKILPLADDPGFQEAFRKVKQNNKQIYIDCVKREYDVQLNPDAMFDVQIKRLHEYKRQLLNVMHIITRYNHMRANPNVDILPRTMLFAGKAAPGYAMAKLIIKLISDVADVVNNDPMIGDKLKVLFLPNYNVTNAQRLIPAAELSEQISTAGTEASGTGNMKLALNGALTIGTLDGANIEIRDEVGADNIFIFGHTAEEVQQLRNSGYNPWDYYNGNDDLRQVVDMLNSGYFCADEPERFRPIVDALMHGGDRFMLLADYASYIECQYKVDELYRQPQEWNRKAILNVAKMGKFSSDRTIREYAQDIWNVTPCVVKNS